MTDRSRSSARLAVTAAATSLVLVSCGGAPDAGPAADALAGALESGQFTGAPVTGTDPATAEEDLAEIVEGLGEVTRTVRVDDIAEVESADDTRVATLTVGWDLGTDEAWTYPVTATLTLADDEWHAEWAPSLLHPDLEPGDRLASRRVRAERADVLGADDAVLVTNRPVYRIGIDKTTADEADHAAAAATLAEIVGIDAERFADRVEAAGDRAFVEAITLREDDARDVLDEVDDIEGARALSDTLPLAPTREFARPLLGAVGEATAEIVEESDGRVQPGDTVGLSGLQLQYDEVLAGAPGMVVERVPEEGDAAVLYEREPEPGTPVATTLDPDLQILAEEILADVGPPSAIVAMEASTGNVLAAASGPGAEGYSTATLGQYAPGSTFKVVSTLALLRAGMEPDDVLPCTDTITVDGREFGNYSDYPSGALGDISLRTAFAQSCNTAFIAGRDTVPQSDLAEAAAALGLGLENDPGVPAFLGSVPDEADGTEHAASMIGQGRVLASPLAMATVAASVTAGRTVVPRIVHQGEAEAPDLLDEGEAQALGDLMRTTVEEGTGDFLRDIPGDPVGAKTGTAEYGDETPPDTHGWMIGVHGDLAVAVFVEDAESGSATAGPLLADFLRSAR